MAILILADNQRVILRAEFISEEGNQARVYGDPEWDTSSPDLLALQPAANGLTCMVTPLGPLGVGQVNVTADADLGRGTRIISGVVTVEVVSSEAVAVAINAGLPEYK